VAAIQVSIIYPERRHRHSGWWTQRRLPAVNRVYESVSVGVQGSAQRCPGITFIFLVHFCTRLISDRIFFLQEGIIGSDLCDHTQPMQVIISGRVWFEVAQVAQKF